jgi:hypothetical protein
LAGVSILEDFSNVLKEVGVKPSIGASQNELRHYSEELSRLGALWLKKTVEQEFPDLHILPPEGKVDTIYGVGNRGKSLDVAGKSENGYLAIDFSIKTFNFKDRRTNNYRKNYTGRFYELLGEELDIRRSYEFAILVALVLLPADSVEDSNPSSFALAVKQFSKIAKLSTASPQEFGFEFVFIGLHDGNGMVFFDATAAPPGVGLPDASSLLSPNEMLSLVKKVYESRKSDIKVANLPKYIPFAFT